MPALAGVTRNAARNWEAFDQIVASLRGLEADETLLVQSGKPVGVFRTHADAPRVLIANLNIVPHWATWEHFQELDRKGLVPYGTMSAIELNLTDMMSKLVVDDWGQVGAGPEERDGDDPVLASRAVAVGHRAGFAMMQKGERLGIGQRLRFA